MIEEIGNNPSILLLQKCLDASALRHKVISNNIANATTPGFKASDVSFQGEVKKLLDEKNAEKIDLSVTDKNHISPHPPDLSELMPRVITSSDTYRQIDGNNVDIDREMSTLAENSLAFRTYTRLLGDAFTAMNSAIRGE
jgi:flagellar basal-body rod protein FlgB